MATPPAQPGPGSVQSSSSVSASTTSNAASSTTSSTTSNAPRRWASAATPAANTTSRWQSSSISATNSTASSSNPTRPADTSATTNQRTVAPTQQPQQQQQPQLARPQQQPQQGVQPGSSSSQPSGTGVVRRATTNSILVNTVQKGNPVIAQIRNVPWEYGDIVGDYQVGATAGVLYLSLRYHLLHPEYIHTRIKKMSHSYALRIMLVLCDVDNYQAAIRELTKVCIINEYTMMVAWSNMEAARYLETYKLLERKAPDVIKERVDNSYMAHLTSCLTSVKGVNKTDVVTLASNFGTFKNIVNAPSETLSMLPGLGDKKIKRLRDAFETNFVVASTQAQKKRMSNSAARTAGESGSIELN
ncbi:ssDNA endonuclease and repair protein rad10 [Microbotryomycetes sp. JL221]|nr:ssDNA endonuclease and repair protein rad10 [Microbotryomycetes sp. JL221]